MVAAVSRRHPSLQPRLRAVTAFVAGVMRGKALIVLLPVSVLFVLLALLADGKMKRDTEGRDVLATVSSAPGQGNDNNRQPAP